MDFTFNLKHYYYFVQYLTTKTIEELSKHIEL